MRRRPQSTSGYINLPKENFKKMVERASNATDMGTLVNAHANYLGHRNILPHSYVDMMLKKALEIGQPDTMLEVFKLHAELAYTPSVEVLAAYLDHYSQGPYEKFVLFFAALRGNFFNVKPAGFHAKAIELGSENNDSKTVINAYLDILDYKSAGLTPSHLLKVFNSINYEKAIDHALVDHLGKTAKTLGFGQDASLKAHQAAYFFKIKGYLSAADVLKEIAANKQDKSKIESSELLKKEIFTSGLFDGSIEIDADIRSQLVEAIKSIPESKWTDRGFY
jgi:hypothetical protein